jgi:hypothetical protein
LLPAPRFLLPATVLRVFKGEFKMAFMQKRITELVFAPRSRLIWLALAGFFLGSALCPFNPPSEDGLQQIKQGTTMNGQSEN